MSSLYAPLANGFGLVVVTFRPFEGLARSVQLPIMTSPAAEQASHYARCRRLMPRRSRSYDTIRAEV